MVFPLTHPSSLLVHNFVSTQSLSHPFQGHRVMKKPQTNCHILAVIGRCAGLHEIGVVDIWQEFSLQHSTNPIKPGTLPSMHCMIMPSSPSVLCRPTVAWYCFIVTEMSHEKAKGILSYLKVGRPCHTPNDTTAGRRAFFSKRSGTCVLYNKKHCSRLVTPRALWRACIWPGYITCC